MCDNATLSKLWPIITTILAIWFVAGIIVEDQVCSWSPADETSEWFGILLFVVFFCGQYVMGYDCNI